MTPTVFLDRRDLRDQIIEPLLSLNRVPAPLLVGPAGIGKSSLLGLVRATMKERGRSAVMVTGSVPGQDVVLGAFAGPLAQLRPHDTADSSFELIRHITGVRNTTCLLVDNVDRLDPASLFVVSHFVRDARLPTVLTVRDIASLPEGIRELYDGGLVDVVDVPALRPDEAVAMAELILRGRLTPVAAATLVSRAGGNPLYVRELIVGSRSGGSLVEVDHGWDFVDLPRATPRLAQLVGQGLSGLGEASLDLAGLLAVAGGVPARLLGAQQVDQLVRRGVAVIDHDGMLTLSHPLFGEALHEQVPEAMIARYRENAIELLTSAVPEEELLAPALVGLYLGAGRTPPVDLALREARRAQGVMDHARAHRLSQHVLSRERDHAEACWLAGAAASGLGQLDEADALLRRAVRLASSDTETASAARSLAHHLAVRRHDPLVAVEVLEKALNGLTDVVARSRVEHDLVQWQMVGGLNAVMPAPPSNDDGSAYTHYLMLTLMVALISGPLSVADEKARELEGLALLHADEVPTGPAITKMARFMLLSYSGDIIAAREVAERFLDVTDEQPEMRGSWEYSLGMIELLAGDLGRAANLAEKAVEHLQWRDPLGLLGTALALGEAANTGLGRFVVAADYAAKIPEFSLVDPKVVMLRSWAEAWREHSAGRDAAAADLIVSAAENLMASQHVFLAGMLAHCAARVGHPGQALVVLTQVAQSGGGVLELFLEHARAMNDRDDTALSGLVDVFDSFGMRTTAIDTAAFLARRARRHRKVMEARRWDWFADQGTSAQMPVALWFHRLRSETQLSAREREVALMAARRLTSREIGLQLGVSEKTVNNHLGAVYRKLGLSGRSELREVLEDASVPGQ